MSLISSIIMFLASVSCFANDYVAFGDTQKGLNNYFTVGDFNLFSPDKPDSLNIHRYGLGSAQFQFGSPISLFAEANTGFIFMQNHNIALSMEPINGMIDYTNTGVYAWRPALSLGYSDGPIYIGPRFIYTVSNNAIEPGGYGAGVVLQVYNFSYWQNPSFNIFSYTLNNHINIEKRNNNIQDTYVIMLKRIW